MCETLFWRQVSLLMKFILWIQKSTKNMKKICMKHEIQKQLLHNQKIEKSSKLLKHYVLLKNHFVILSYHQSDVQKTLFSKKSFVSFCIQDLDNLNLKHYTRQYHKANIRQVFFYKIKLQKIISLQFYHQSQSMLYYLFSKHCFKKSFETHWKFLSNLLILTEHAVFISHQLELLLNLLIQIFDNVLWYDFSRLILKCENNLSDDWKYSLDIHYKYITH